MFRFIGELLQNDYFTGFICVLFAVNFIIALTIIFLERKTPTTALAWVMVLFLLPVLGIVMYFFFSQNIARKQTVEQVLTGIEPGLEGLQKMCKSEYLNARTTHRRIGF